METSLLFYSLALIYPLHCCKHYFKMNVPTSIEWFVVSELYHVFYSQFILFKCCWNLDMFISKTTINPFYFGFDVLNGSKYKLGNNNVSPLSGDCWIFSVQFQFNFILLRSQFVLLFCVGCFRYSFSFDNDRSFPHALE